MLVIGFKTNIGPGRRMDEETEEQYCSAVIISLKLHEGTEITGNNITCISYDNETGMATVMFERGVSESLAETLLSKNDIFIFDELEDEDE